MVAIWRAIAKVLQASEQPAVTGLGLVSWRRILRRNVRGEVSDEIAFHIQMRTAELIEQGVDRNVPRPWRKNVSVPCNPSNRNSPAVSSGAGGRRPCRGIHGSGSGSAIRRSFLRRAPGFTSAAIVTLALGVNATLAVFNVVNGVLLRPLPYGDPSRIQMVWITREQRRGDIRDPTQQRILTLDIERQARSFEGQGPPSAPGPTR